METTQNNKAQLISQGIEELIDQLKEKGVTAGKEKAENLVNAAEQKANKIVNDAQLKAKALMEEAHQNILKEQKAAQDALQLAARNMRIELRQNLMDRFSQEVKRLVHKELDNEDMVRQLILLIGTNTSEQLHAFKAKHITLQLPEKALDFNEIRANPDLLKDDALKPLVQSLTSTMLKEGMKVTINPNNCKSAGIQVHLIDENIVLDLTEDAVSQLLIKHMQPRFRALLEGLLQ
jgi:V/A-type H+/Na+-transporting ATPase subunit E